jgi:hypothetical protein
MKRELKIEVECEFDFKDLPRDVYLCGTLGYVQNHPSGAVSVEYNNKLGIHLESEEEEELVFLDNGELEKNSFKVSCK